MGSFARFILSILAVGTLVNLAIVILADRHGMQAQSKNALDTRNGLDDKLKQLDGHFRQAYIAVERQEIQQLESGSKVTRSSLLIRPYVLRAEPHGEAHLPVVEVEIPGDTLYVDAISLDFSGSYSSPQEDAYIFRSRRFFLFYHLWGEDQKIPDRYSFLNQDVPPVLRVYPQQREATYFEQQLWHHLMEHITDPNLQHSLDAGLTLKTFESKPIRLERGGIYLATISAEGLTVTAPPESTLGLLHDMQEELQQRKDAATDSEH